MARRRTSPSSMPVASSFGFELFIVGSCQECRGLRKGGRWGVRGVRGVRAHRGNVATGECASYTLAATRRSQTFPSCPLQLLTRAAGCRAVAALSTPTPLARCSPVAPRGSLARPRRPSDCENERLYNLAAFIRLSSPHRSNCALHGWTSLSSISNTRSVLSGPMVTVAAGGTARARSIYTGCSVSASAQWQTWTTDAAERSSVPLINGKTGAKR
eukprot:scaffold3580_cov115-Isochrysis_galbana.AAC.2